MTISGYVSQLPVEVILAPNVDTVKEYVSQVCVEVISLQFYTNTPVLGDNVNYYVDDETDDKNPNKVHPGGHVGGSKGPVITLLAFENVQVPKGVTVLDAYVVFTASDTDSSSTVNANIVALDEDSPEIPDTYADLILAPTTTAYALWSDIGAWVAENEYNSVSITNVVQEIIDRVGWERGNTVVILFEDSSSSPNSNRKAYSKLTSGKEPQLIIEWVYQEDSGLDTPVLDPISNPLNQDSYTVTWNTVAGATSFQLWEQENEEDWFVTYSGALLSQDFSEKESATWSYRVRATDDTVWSLFSNVESTGVFSEVLTSKFNLGISL